MCPLVKPRASARHLHSVGSNAASWPDVTAKDAGKKVLLGAKEKEMGSTPLRALLRWSRFPPLSGYL